MSNWTTPCPNCPGKYRAIGGDGPQPAPVLCILERPGYDENRAGRVACGKTGQELDELYLPLAGLDRSQVRVCNTVLCWADNNKKPSDKDILACASHHLAEEIVLTNPDVIIMAGATPCSLLPGLKLKMMHGIPQHTSKVGELFGWSGWIVPMYHPAMGLHESRWMKSMMDDWRVALQKCFHDPAPEPTNYQRLHGEIAGMHPRIALDTESHGGKPWSIQWSGYKGTGYMLFADDQRGISKFAAWLCENETEVIFHNAAYDLEVLRKLGINVRSYRDTMQEAFHLGDLPHGLKELSYRLFRHTMTSYDETVRPASIRALQSWMQEALQIAILDLSFVETVQMKTKTKEVVKRGPLESLLTRLIRLAEPLGEYNPWGGDDEPRLDAFWRDPCNEWMVNHVEARIGRYPILGIGNCTMDEAVRYAVGDSDWTGRCAVELARRRQGAFKIFEGDRDNHHA